MDEPSDAAQLLARAQAGDASASQALFVLLQSELRALAGELMAAEGAAHTLQPTALVHEAWIRLFAHDRASSRVDRAHFVRTVARAMRHVLVDHARAKRRVKRDAARVEGLDLTLAAVEGVEQLEVVALDEALQRFAQLDPDGARVVELRFFCGLTNEQVAQTMGVSLSSVERSWRTARLWLSRAIHGGGGASE